jgi:exopolysaccharide biosynthesis polyprenyl glycosylphosphotransferase
MSAEPIAARAVAPVLGRPAPAALRSLRPAEASLVEATVLRYGIRPLLFGADAGSATVAAAVTGNWSRVAVVYAAVLLLVATLRGLHRSRLTLSVLDDGPSLLLCSAGAASMTLLIADPMPHTIVALAGAQAALMLGFRAVAYAFVRETRRRRVVEHPTLVLGAGRIGGRLASVLNDHPEYGLLPVGFLDDEPLLTEDERPVPVLGSYAALPQVLVEFGVRNVIVAFGGLAESEIVDVIHTCDQLDCEVFFVPRLFELHSSNHDTETVWGLPLVRLRRAAFRRPSWRLKRAVDLFVSSLALVIAAPVILVCMLALRLDNGPGVLFRQERVGLDGRRFMLLKLRTLRPADDGESATLWSVANDHRLGRVGRFLRRTSLDELPQLWNIFRGDMTLVGPRPERPHFVDMFRQTYTRYMARHRVPAGLTGWAQVHGLRGDTSIEERARFDNFYIENWSIWTDVKIMLRTLASVFGARGG